MIVKICSTFFATGQFEGEEFQAGANWIRMKHKGHNKIFPEKDYLCSVYWLPIDKTVHTIIGKKQEVVAKFIKCRH